MLQRRGVGILHTLYIVLAIERLYILSLRLYALHVLFVISD